VTLVASPPTPLLSVRGVRKQFTATVALKGVDFELRPGEVHALVGENGAGKSTLIKILAGVYARDSGRISFLGDDVDPASHRLPIAFIHQDLGLAGTLTVAENIAVVSGYPTRLGLINWRRVRANAEEVLQVMGTDLAPTQRVERLSVAERSIVALARAMWLQRRVVVLDEATAALPEHDVARLFEVLRNIRAHGVGIVYVTHRLDEVFRIADRVTVLRDGRWVCTRPIETLTQDELIQQMTGRRIEASHAVAHEIAAQPVLEVSDLVAAHAGPVSFEVRPGEILGLVGLRGAGHDILGRAIYGATPARSGRVTVDGRALPLGNIAEALDHGLGFISSKRAEENIASLLTVRENVFLNPHLFGSGAWRLYSRRRESLTCESALDRFSVRPKAPDVLIDTLSGGNQQKVILARWLSLPQRRVLILEEPTTGVDVGARSDIYAMLLDATRRGLGVLLISSDFEEIAAVASRALVLAGGRVVADLGAGHITLDHLSAAASGSTAAVV
jgi:ribose transport system ATP-binding protein